jgi:hypothetical protein
VLDGGHIMMAMIERIRRRRWKCAFVEYTTTVFAVLLISFHALRHFFTTSSECPCSRMMFNRETQIEQPENPPQPGPGHANRPINHALLSFSLPLFAPPRPVKWWSAIRPRRRHHWRRPSGRQTIHDHLRHDGHRRVRQTIAGTGGGRLPDRPHHRPDGQGRRQPEEHRRRIARPRLPVPIVADIHFKPDAAMEAAKWVEMVRVNPGNYADKKKFAVREYSDDQYDAELARLEEQFTPLVLLCKNWAAPCASAPITARSATAS